MSTKPKTKKSSKKNVKMNDLSFRAIDAKVNKLASKMNKVVETKTFSYLAPDLLPVGQVNGNATGSQCFMLKMLVGTGSANAGRISNAVYLKGFQLRMQFIQQSAAVDKLKYIVEIFKTSDVNLNITSVPALVYDPDTMSTVIDYFSGRLPTFNKLYKRVFSKTVSIAADAYSGVYNTVGLKEYIKTDQILEWNDTIGDDPNNVRYVCIVRADVGNCSTSTANTTTGVPIKSVNTGSNMFYAIKYYYNDA